jgi:NifB/MoaA-like Fe-S oxidoreductase
VAVEGVENSFFGPMITVSGLLTGKDIIGQLEGKDIGDCVFVPDNLLKSGETVLLDDITLEDIETALGVAVVPIDQYGSDFVDRIFNFS